MGTEATNKEEQPKWECGEWEARHERRPGKPPLLMISGECKVPTTYRVVLQPHEPQGDPDVLLLDLAITLPSAGAGKVEHSEPFLQLFMTKKAVIYVNYKVETETEYQTVTILDAESGEEVKSGIKVRPILAR